MVSSGRPVRPFARLQLSSLRLDRRSNKWLSDGTVPEVIDSATAVDAPTECATDLNLLPSLPLFLPAKSSPSLLSSDRLN